MMPFVILDLQLISCLKISLRNWVMLHKPYKML